MLEYIKIQLQDTEGERDKKTSQCYKTSNTSTSRKEKGKKKKMKRKRERGELLELKCLILN